MRLLVLTFYSWPDLSAGSFRATSLVGALREQAPAGTHIDVITTLPNRYRTFSREAAQTEQGPGWELRRIQIPPHRSDMPGQARAFRAFRSRGAGACCGSKYDVVFATSSRLMTAALAAWIAGRKHARLYLDIRDIFVDTIKDVLPAPLAWPVRSCFSLIESWTMRHANRINLVSPGFAECFRSRYGDRPLSWFTNGVDAEFVQAAVARRVAPEPDGPARIVYAGNIGAGQALEGMLPAAGRRVGGTGSFHRHR